MREVWNKCPRSSLDLGLVSAPYIPEAYRLNAGSCMCQLMLVVSWGMGDALLAFVFR